MTTPNTISTSDFLFFIDFCVVLAAGVLMLLFGVWRGEAYARLRAAQRSGQLDGVTPCDGCDHWKMYYMDAGFLGRTYAKRG